MGKCKIWETQCSYGHVAGAKKKVCKLCKVQNAEQKLQLYCIN